MLPLRAAIHKAKKTGKAVRREHVRIQQNGETRTANVEVIPLKNLREGCFLILFEEAAGGRVAPRAPLPAMGAKPGARGATRPPGEKNQSRRIADLEDELSETRDYLQSIQEQQESANEELQ